MKDFEQLEEMKEKILEEEKRIAEETIKLKEYYEKEIDPIKKIHIMLDKIISNEIRAIMIMDRANLITWVQIPDNPELNKQLSEAISLTSKNHKIIKTTLDNLKEQINILSGY